MVNAECIAKPHKRSAVARFGACSVAPIPTTQCSRGYRELMERRTLRHNRHDRKRNGVERGEPCYSVFMTKNKAPIGSLWIITIRGESKTYEVASDPIPGNDLRKVIVRPSGEETYLGRNWFRRGVMIAERSNWK